ncbi:MAG: hypothetical protein U0359_32635 [Byssovorax sp.]
MNTKNWLGIGVAIMSIVAACNYTEGECYPVGQSDGPASADVGVGVASGAGGYGDTPPGGSQGTGANACNMGDLSEETPPPDEGGDAEDTWVDCKKLKLDPVECMIRCAEAGRVCRARREHPYKSNVGWGDLFNCKNGQPTNTCSYNYPNGDTCIFFGVFSVRVPVCLYTGGK